MENKKWIKEEHYTIIGADIEQFPIKLRKFYTYCCPYCNFLTGEIAENFNFCPNCGIDMRKLLKS